MFQIVAHKNLNGYHRVEGIPSHLSLHAPISRKISSVLLVIEEELQLMYSPAVSHTDMWPDIKESP